MSHELSILINSRREILIAASRRPQTNTDGACSAGQVCIYNIFPFVFRPRHGDARVQNKSVGCQGGTAHTKSGLLRALKFSRTTERNHRISLATATMVLCVKGSDMIFAFVGIV
jgi:hypothetical protein